MKYNNKAHTSNLKHQDIKDRYCDVELSDSILEVIEDLFQEEMRIYISENGFRYEYDFDEELYLEKYTTDEKLKIILLGEHR